MNTDTTYPGTVSIIDLLTAGVPKRTKLGDIISMQGSTRIQGGTHMRIRPMTIRVAILLARDDRPDTCVRGSYG